MARLFGTLMVAAVLVAGLAACEDQKMAQCDPGVAATSQITATLPAGSCK